VGSKGYFCTSKVSARQPRKRRPSPRLCHHSTHTSSSPATTHTASTDTASTAPQTTGETPEKIGRGLGGKKEKKGTLPTAQATVAGGEGGERGGGAEGQEGEEEEDERYKAPFLGRKVFVGGTRELDTSSLRPRTPVSLRPHTLVLMLLYICPHRYARTRRRGAGAAL
jgi:hypothetical protein